MQRRFLKLLYNLLRRATQTCIFMIFTQSATYSSQNKSPPASTPASQTASNDEIYCLTEVDKRLNPYSPSSKTTSIQITMGGRPYTVAVDDPARRIQLLDEHRRKVSEADAPQYEFGTIEDIKQLSPDLLWVGGLARDYLVSIGSNPPELVNSRPPVTDLFTEPRSAFTFDWRPAQGRYISALNGVWVTGYPETFWGTKEQKLYLVRASGVTDLTPVFGATPHVAESRQINGAIVQDSRNRPMFYDGQRVVPIAPGVFDNSIPDKKWMVLPATRTTESRLFLVGNLLRANQSNSLVYEVLAGGRTRIFPVSPPSSGQFWLEDTGDGRLWGKAKQQIYREIDGTFQRITSSQPGASLGGVWTVEINGQLKLLAVTAPIANGRKLKQHYYTLSANDPACPAANRFKAPIVIQH